MKIVVCKDCGAEYQLEDYDDINAFECSSCTGSLEELESFPDEDNSNTSIAQNSDSVFVYCKNCGMKFQLSANDDINEFECTNCDGPLDYVANMESLGNPEVISESISSDSISKDYGSINDLGSEGYSDVNYGNQDVVDKFEDNVYESDEPYFERVSQEEYDNLLDNTDYDIVPIHAEHNSSNDVNSGFSSEGGMYYGYDNALPDVEILESNSDFNDSVVSYNSDSNYDDLNSSHSQKEYHGTDASDSYVVDSNSSVNEGVEKLPHLVDVTNIPDEELSKSPVSLARGELSQYDKKLFKRFQNERVFDSPEEYEEFRLARYKYYSSLLTVLKKEYVLSLDEEIAKLSSAKGFIRKGDDFKSSRFTASGEDALVSKENEESMRSMANRVYEPKKSFADVYILFGAFLLVVSIAYYFINNMEYILLLIVIGALILIFGIYKKYVFNNYLARGRIIREKLLALPNDFYVFYAVQPPQSNDIINHVVVGPTGLFTILSKRYDAKDYKNKLKSENERMNTESASIQDYRDKKNTLELQTDYKDNQSRFQFGNEFIQFEDNSKIKHTALGLSEELAIFLDTKGFSGVYIEPLLGFVNNDLAILNVILTNDDLFIDELLNKMVRGKRRLDNETIIKIARLLSHYSAKCSEY